MRMLLLRLCTNGRAAGIFGAAAVQDEAKMPPPP